MKLCDNHTLNLTHYPRELTQFCISHPSGRRFDSSRLISPLVLLLAVIGLTFTTPIIAAPTYSESDVADRIEIVEGDNKTIYEYRQNGVLTMIKIVPKKGRPYYLVPADGAPHFESLDHKKKLYPQWVILEW